MIIIPIDKKINCQRMLSTKEFQTKYWHNEELCWLIKYLKLNRYSKENIYQNWKFFRLKDKNEYDEEMLYCDFKSFNKLSKTVVFKDRPKIFVYQEEINYINSLPIPLWIRQYVYFLLLHIKCTENIYYDCLPYYDYYRLLPITDKHEKLRYNLLKKLKQLGIVENTEIIEKHKSLPICDENGFVVGIENDVVVTDTRLKINLNINHYSEPIKIYVTILDALNDIDKINANYKCPICGKEYEFTKRMKRDICQSCYAKKRNKQKNYARDHKNK